MGNGGLTWILFLNVYLFCRGLMECHRRGQCMRSDACLTQTSTGFGWGALNIGVLVGKQKFRYKEEICQSQWPSPENMAPEWIAGNKEDDTLIFETVLPSRRSEPPDPNTEGKFWQSEGSDDEGSNDERIMEHSRMPSRQKSRDKPSNFLDGTIETALRRYGLRSAGSNVGISNTLTNGVTTCMQRRGKDSGKEARIPSGKENIPDCANHALVLDFDPKAPCESDPIVVRMDIAPPPMQEENNNFCTGQDVTMQNSEPLHESIEIGMNDGQDNILQRSEAGLMEGGVMMNMEYAGDSILNDFSGGGSHA
ncbi:hypothetical protein L1987_67241 [Smallanthus sonchifolius]|uniref:Uncharacterized protein n=1 Tax=Smallanthus sonchifolius TaxID=185202 RepID=A0ACB9BZD9_9ASTR|nr:hypothetical protein L1987_67241 [Smallanthus sonchifolius]